MAKVTMKERKESLIKEVAQLQEVITGLVGTKVNDEEVKTLNTRLDKLITIIAPGVGHSAVEKIDADGNVFCTYFGTYLPADKFATKKNKKGEETYKSMSKIGEKLHKAANRAIHNAEIEVVAQMRAGDITTEEANSLFDKIDSAKDYKAEIGTTELPADFPYAL